MGPCLGQEISKASPALPIATELAQMEACEDSAAEQECQPMRICGHVLIQAITDLSGPSTPQCTTSFVAGMSVQLTPNTSGTDSQATSHPLLQTHDAGKLLPVRRILQHLIHPTTTPSAPHPDPTKDHFAVSVNRASRTTVTLISPG